jgi:hypothetical protein
MTEDDTVYDVMVEAGVDALLKRFLSVEDVSAYPEIVCAVYEAMREARKSVV